MHFQGRDLSVKTTYKCLKSEAVFSATQFPRPLALPSCHCGSPFPPPGVAPPRCSRPKPSRSTPRGREKSAFATRRSVSTRRGLFPPRNVSSAGFDWYSTLEGPQALKWLFCLKAARESAYKTWLVKKGLVLERNALVPRYSLNATFRGFGCGRCPRF
jgi:hypothetical protein